MPEGYGNAAIFIIESNSVKKSYNDFMSKRENEKMLRDLDIAVKESVHGSEAEKAEKRRNENINLLVEEMSKPKDNSFSADIYDECNQKIGSIKKD